MDRTLADKIVVDWITKSAERLDGFCAFKRRNGIDPHSTVAVAVGCFNLLHAGHLKSLSWVHTRSYLKKKRLGQLVLLNNDEGLQAQGREAVRPFLERALALAMLPWVNGVIGFSERTPDKLIEVLRPDIMVKGSEYVGEEIPGAQYIIANGGMLLYVPMECVPGSKTDYLHSSRTVIDIRTKAR